MRWLVDHLERQSTAYLMAAVLLVGLGAFGGSFGQQWLTQTIDGRITSRLKVLEERVGGIEGQISEQSELLLAGQIRDVHERWCQQRTDDRRQRLDELQIRYRRLTGTTYDTGRCPP